MLKGLGVSQRNSWWHKQHARKLLKDKERHGRGQNMELKTKVEMARAEQAFKRAQEKEQERRAGSWWRRLWAKFRSLKFMVYILRSVHQFQERQYRG